MSDEKNVIFVGELESYKETDGLGKFIFDSMKQHGDAIFQIDVLNGKEDSYTEALSRMVKTAITMRKRGVKRGDIVAVCDDNHLNTCIPFMAALFLGATATAADHKLVLEDIAKLLKMIKAKFIFTSSEAEETVVRAIKDALVDTQIVVFDKSAYGNLEFKEFLDVTSEEEKTFEPTKIEDLKAEKACIMFSSGSTGLPKGICLNHYSFLTQIRAKSLGISLTDTRILNFSGIYWIAKIMVYFYGIFQGATIMIASFDEDRAWGWIEKYKVNMITLSGILSRKLFRREEVKNIDMSSLKFIVLLGSKVYDYQIKELENKCPHSVVVAQLWAMTETSGYGFTVLVGKVSQVSPEKRYTSIGIPAKGVYHKVVDLETGKALGPNQPGELRLKSEVEMIGYLDRDSSDAWDEDGYLKTGDMMYYDEDLYFYYVERIGEMFKYRYEYVHPDYVENVFLSHPDVNSVVVVGLPHPEDDMHPAAMVTLNKFGCVSAEELREYVEEKMNHRIFLMGGVYIVNEIPVPSSGKVKRREIQKLIQELRNNNTVNTNNAT